MIDDIDPAYLPSLLRRVSPFESWAIIELYGIEKTALRPADEVGGDCGLPTWRITEIAERAIAKMKAMQTQLAAD